MVSIITSSKLRKILRSRIYESLVKQNGESHIDTIVETFKQNALEIHR